jgi:hypothetical protein
LRSGAAPGPAKTPWTNPRLSVPKRLFPYWEHDMFGAVRVIARNVLVDFWSKHPETNVALERW